MALIATDKGGKDFKPAPAGTFMAVCVQVIDLGTQHSEFYNTDAHKVMVGWELPTEIDEDDATRRPFIVWKHYTLSLGTKATLRAHLEAWRGRKFTETELEGFHLKDILGAPCMLNIVHQVDNGQTFANVAAVMAMPKGTPKPDRVRELLMFDIDAWDDKVFETFGENLRKKIMKSKEAQAVKGNRPVTMADVDASLANGHTPVPEDDIPF